MALSKYLTNARSTEDTTPLVNSHGPNFLHNNAKPHVYKLTFRKLNKVKYEIIRHIYLNLLLLKRDVRKSNNQSLRGHSLQKISPEY